MKRHGSIEHHDRDFDDAVAAERAHARGLHVDDRKATGVERRAFGWRRGGEHPAPIDGASEPRIRGEQGASDEIGGVPVGLRNAQHVSDNGQAGGRAAL